MGAISSAQRDSKRDESPVSEPSAGQEDEAQEDSAAEKLLQKNGQISSLNGKTESQPDELNLQLDDVGSGYVTLKEDTTKTTEDLQEGDTSQTNTEEELAKEPLHADGITVKEVEETGSKQNDIEVGFKKMFRFVGFKFTLKKDKVAKTNEDEPTTNEEDSKVAISLEDSKDTTEQSTVSTSQQEADADETKEDIIVGDIQDGSKDDYVSSKTEQEMASSQISEIPKHNEETPPDKEQMEEVPQSSESEEPMSPIKRFFTRGIFASLRKKRKEEALKEKSEEELVKTDEDETEKLSGTAQEDSSCICLNISNILPEEGKNIHTEDGDEQKPEGEKDQTNPPEQEKVPASPLIRLFRKLSTRRTRETKPAETSLIEPGENVDENIQSTTELVNVLKEEKEVKREDMKPTDVDEITDLSPEESKKKSDSTVSWDSLICLKRARKTSNSEDAMQDKGEEPRRSTESPLGSSTEGDYDHLTSSNEQAGEESGSTWKSLKKLVTPKRKARMEESGSSEQIPSDTEITKDESSCSIKKLIPGRKKRRSDGQQEQLSSEDTGKGTGGDDEDDETPAVVPLSEFEIIVPESLKEIEHGTGFEKEVQPLIEEDKPKVTKPSVIPSYDVRPSVMSIPSDYIEDLTEFISKHQQLSDIPEEGIIEESVATPVSSAEWTTQDDTLAEDFVELTADAVTAPEPASEHGDDTTEMVSAVSQLTESPKTSGNVTPVLPECDLREAVVIIQEAVETSCITPNVMSITTKDNEPEVLAVSISPCILESTTTAETKVLVAHEKAEATTICIGLVSQEIGAVEEIIPSPLVEGISEINEAVTTELVSEDITEGSELAGLATDGIYKVEVKEIKTEVHEALSLDVPQTQGEVHLKAQEDEGKEYPKDVINGYQEPTPVQMAVINVVRNETQEQAVTKSMTDVPEIEGPLDTALEESVQKQPALYTEITVEGEKDHKLPDVKLLVTDTEHVALAEVVESEQNIIVSLTDSTIDEASEITEDTVQVSLAEVVETVTHNAAGPGPETATDDAKQITEARVGVLATAVEHPETAEAISIISPVSGSIKAVVELEEELQMEIVASICYEDGHATQVERKGAEIDTAKAKVDTVLDAAIAVDKADIYEKVEEIKDDETEQQQIEPTPVEESCEHFAEEIVPNIKMEIAAEPKCKENELNLVIKDVSPSAATTDEPEQPQGVLEVNTTESVDTNITFAEDNKPKQISGEEVDIAPLNKVEKQMTQVPVILDLTLLQKESAEECHPVTTDRPVEIPPENQKVELIVETHKTEAAPESAEEDLAKTEIKTTSTDAEVTLSVTLSEEGPEQKEETSKHKISFKIPTEPQENVEPETLPVITVPKAQQPQADSVSSKPDENQATESGVQLNEEDTVKLTETISVTAPIYVDETKQSEVVLSTNEVSNETEQICEVQKNTTDAAGEGELKISEQKLVSVQHLEETLSKDKETVMTAEAIKVEATLIVNQEPEASVTSVIHVNEKVEETTSQQETNKVVSGLNTEMNKVSEQHIDAVASKMNKETPAEIELKEKILTRPEVEKVETTKQVTEPQATENKSKTPTVQKAEGEAQEVKEYKAEALEVMEPKVETHVVTEVKVETAVVTENEVEKPVVTSVVTELEVETPVVTPAVTEPEVDKTVVTSEVTVPEADKIVVTSVVTEQEAHKTVVTSVVTVPETDKTVVTSVVTEQEAHKTVLTSAITVPETDKTVLTSAATVPEADRTVVLSAVTVPDVDKTLVPSVVAEPEADKTIVTSAVAVPEVDKTVVTTAVTVPEADKTIVKSAVAVPEVDKTVVTTAVTVPEADKTIVTSAVAVPEVDKTVVSSVVTEPEADKTLVTSVVKVSEADKIVVTSAVTVPEADKIVASSVVAEPEADKTIVTSAVAVPEVDKTVVSSVVTEPEADKTLVTSVVKVSEADKIVVTSAVTVPEADKIVASSVVAEPKDDKTEVTSVVTEHEAEKTVVTSAEAIPEADKTVVTLAVTVPEAAKTVTSVVTVPETDKTAVSSAITVPETDKAIVTSAPKVHEADKTVVTSAVKVPESDKTVVTSAVKVHEVDKSVVTSAVMVSEVAKTVTSAVTVPGAAKTVVTSAVTVSEADKTVVTSAVIVPEADKTVVTSAVIVPEADKTVVTSAVIVPEADKTGVTSEAIVPEADKTVVTLAVTVPEADKTVVTSAVQEPSEVRTVAAVAQGTTGEGIPTIGETPTVVPDMQKAAVVPELQTLVSKGAEMVPVIKGNNAKPNTPVVVELTEPTLELPEAVEVVIQTAVSDLEAELPDVISALITETVVQTYVEKKLEIQSTVVAPAKEDKASEPPVISISQTPEVLTSTIAPTIQYPATVIMEQKPEVPAATSELNKTKPDTSDAAVVPSLKVIEKKAETTVFTEIEVKAPAVASVTTEFQMTPVKKEEAPVATSVVKEPATAAPLIQTSTLIETPTVVPADEKPTVVQIPTVVTAVQTVGIEVKVAEVPAVATEVKDIHKETSGAVTAEIKPPQMEAVEVTVKKEQVTQKEDTNSIQTINRGPTEVPVSIIKTAEPAPDVEDDVWEDAVDDIRDDESSINKAGAE